MAINTGGGRSRDNFIIVDNEFKAENVGDVFLKYKSIIINALTQNLHDADKDQPGKLIQSIDVKIEHQGSKLSFILSMEDYWRWVDEGRMKGSKQPPVDAMLDFIKVRGLKLNQIQTTKRKSIHLDKSDKKIIKAKKVQTQNQKLKQLAFLIAKGIKKHGIKPTYFFSDVINEELYLKMKTDIATALGRDIEIDFNTALR